MLRSDPRATRMLELKQAGGFKETDHPRAKDGKFTSGPDQNAGEAAKKAAAKARKVGGALNKDLNRMAASDGKNAAAIDQMTADILAKDSVYQSELRISQSRMVNARRKARAASAVAFREQMARRKATDAVIASSRRKPQ
jgi:hypothetical protein